MAKTSLGTNDFLKAAFQDFVTEDLVSAPNTQITNRALVSNSLKAVMGVERIQTKSLVVLPKEFGPNGEVVFEQADKDSRVRFVGDWVQYTDTYGNRTSIGSGLGFIEVTFYGTGLNINAILYTSGMSLLPTIDGGSEGTTIIPASYSNVIGTRNYATNAVAPVTSGLTLGWHTVKLRATTTNINIYGFEILNERSNVLINAGNAFDGGKKESLLAATTSAYNSSITGTKGGRVVKYLLNGAVSEAVTMVDAAQGNLASANHANEEIIRKINWREFGANRGDDFSTLSGNSATGKAFTLDDGTTTLVNNSAYQLSFSGLDCVGQASGTGNFQTITFVGTGLDIILPIDNSNRQADSVLVDGVSIGTLSQGTTTAVRTFKVVSGLPYGTHTVKFGGNASANLFISDFIIYGPKKPTLPAGAIELADYNVMATFVANSTTGIENMSTGVLRKHNTREQIFIGSYNIALQLTDTGGFSVYSSTNSDNQSYTFFGTGVEIRMSASTLNFTVSIDGNSNFSSFTTSSYGLSSFTASTGAGVNPSSGGGIVISGLTLGIHTVKITKTGGAGGMSGLFDIITPIHINNTKIGSLSMKDSRNTSALIIPPKNVDLSKAKAWAYYDKTNTKIQSSFNIASIVNVGTGDFIVYFAKPFKNAFYVLVFTSGTQETTQYSGPSSNRTPSYVRLSSYGSGGALNDSPTECFVVFGEQEDEGA